ncbi:phage major capsid protein [Nocardioides sp. KR10-350]|uniref:phage major capsid protein n=1 Tax=Nocardioides cheoyonin TaxID=3156615 RepID=UPI0032B555A7
MTIRTNDPVGRHLDLARAIKEEFEGKAMPAEAAHQMQQHLAAAMGRSAETDLDGGLSFGGGGVSRKTAAFLEYVRKGDRIAPERKADLVEDDTGEVLIPQDYAGTILKELAHEGVVRGRAFVKPTTKPKVDVGAVNIGTPAWGKLEIQDPATPGAGLGDPPADPKQTITVHDLTALVKIGLDELEDSDDSLEGIVREGLAAEFAAVEDDAFGAGTGDGDEQPVGIASRITGVTDGPTATITQTIASTAAGSLFADDVKRLPYRVSARMRRNGMYLVSPDAAEAVALLTDADGHYLLQPNPAAGEPPTIGGYPVETLESLPAMSVESGSGSGAGTNPSMVFGDLKSGYMIADRQRLRVQRLVELFAAEGKIGLLVTMRVGGDVIRPKAFSALLL